MYIGTAKYVNGRRMVGKKREATRRANTSTTHVYRFVKKKNIVLVRGPDRSGLYYRQTRTYYIHKHTHISLMVMRVRPGCTVEWSKDTHIYV